MDIKDLKEIKIYSRYDPETGNKVWISQGIGKEDDFWWACDEDLTWIIQNLIAELRNYGFVDPGLYTRFVSELGEEK